MMELYDSRQFLSYLEGADTICVSNAFWDQLVYRIHFSLKREDRGDWIGFKDRFEW